MFIDFKISCKKRQTTKIRKIKSQISFTKKNFLTDKNLISNKKSWKFYFKNNFLNFPEQNIWIK